MIVISFILTTTLVLGQRVVYSESLKDVAPAASCKRVDQVCTGFSQAEVDATCCLGYCHVMTVDEFTGELRGYCEKFCKLNGRDCKGTSQERANAKCCSGFCEVIGVDDEGVSFGTCMNVQTSEANGAVPVPPSGVSSAADNMVPAPAASLPSGVRSPADNLVPAQVQAQTQRTLSCTPVDQVCAGFSQGQADFECCSGYCHVMTVDKFTGRLGGFCEEDCKLNGQACKGASQVTANAKCCSGFCEVAGVDEEGDRFGTCKPRLYATSEAIIVKESLPSGVSSAADNMVSAPVRAPADNLVPVSSSCVAEKGSCYGNSFNEADAMCCGDMICTITSLDYDANPPLKGYCNSRYKGTS